MKIHHIFIFIFFGAVAAGGIRGNDSNSTHVASYPSVHKEADYMIKQAQDEVDALDEDQGPPDVGHDMFQGDIELHEADRERELSWRRKTGKSYKSKNYHKKRKQKKYYHDYYDYRKKHKKYKKYKKYHHKKYKPYYRKKKYGYYYYH